MQREKRQAIVNREEGKAIVAQKRQTQEQRYRLAKKKQGPSRLQSLLALAKANKARKRKRRKSKVKKTKKAMKKSKSKSRRRKSRRLTPKERALLRELLR